MPAWRRAARAVCGSVLCTLAYSASKRRHLKVPPILPIILDVPDANTGMVRWQAELSGANNLSRSADGGTLAGTNEIQDDEAGGTGAVYVFTRIGGAWTQTAYLKASNAEQADSLGVAVAISDDGNTLVSAALDEDGATTGIDADQNDNSAYESGAAYVFRRAVTPDWSGLPAPKKTPS